MSQYVNKWLNLNLPRLDCIHVVNFAHLAKVWESYKDPQDKVEAVKLTTYATNPDLTPWYLVVLTAPEGDKTGFLIVDWEHQTTFGELKDLMGVEL